MCTLTRSPSETQESPRRLLLFVSLITSLAVLSGPAYAQQCPQFSIGVPDAHAFPYPPVVGLVFDGSSLYGVTYNYMLYRFTLPAAGPIVLEDSLQLRPPSGGIPSGANGLGRQQNGDWIVSGTLSRPSITFFDPVTGIESRRFGYPGNMPEGIAVTADLIYVLDPEIPQVAIGDLLTGLWIGTCPVPDGSTSVTGLAYDQADSTLYTCDNQGPQGAELIQFTPDACIVSYALQQAGYRGLALRPPSPLLPDPRQIAVYNRDNPLTTIDIYYTPGEVPVAPTSWGMMKSLYR